MENFPGIRHGWVVERDTSTCCAIPREPDAILDQVDAARPRVAALRSPWAARWQKQAAEYAALLRSVIVQASRRVLLEENVPTTEKIVSLFEPHTDIVRKGGRETAYGQKINLATGRSGLVLDVVVETGNPADSAHCLPMLERHCEYYGKVPIHATFDGGYCREQIKCPVLEHEKCPVVQWSFFEAAGRLYGRGTTEAGPEAGSV